MFELHEVVKTYPGSDTTLPAVDGVNLTIGTGEFVVIEGATGAGKSTLLRLLGGLDRSTAGSVVFEGRDLADLSEAKRSTLRLRTFGFVFEHFNLVPTLSALENIEAALAPLGGPRRKKRERALRLLNGVGLADRAGHLPSQLSGGEQQRVAIARALSKGPRVILADEPTGNLDTRTGNEIMAILHRLSRENGQTVVVVTSDRDIAARAPRLVRMRDGRVVADGPGKELHAPRIAEPSVELGAPAAEKHDFTRPVQDFASENWIPTASTPRWTSDPVLHAEGVVKHYVSIESEEDVIGIDGVSLIVHEGEFVAITGPSGSGKTTLLNCLSGLDRIDRGRVLISGRTVHDLSDKDQSHLRSEVMGFIFQNWNLVPVFSAVENVELPLLLNGAKTDDARQQAIATLERIGLGHRIHHHPNMLSGGEQQRVAIARALAANPALLWADEPTGNLDSATAESVMKLLRELNDDGLAIVLVTHDETIAEQATRRLYIRDGKLLADMTRSDSVRGRNRATSAPPPPQAPPPPPAPTPQPAPALDLREEAPKPAPTSKAERRAARREARMNTKPRQDPSPQPGPQPITYDNPFD